MGNFMIPVCCMCGRKAKCWHDDEWYAKGGMQDFCPEHATDELVQYYWGEDIFVNPTDRR